MSDGNTVFLYRFRVLAVGEEGGGFGKGGDTGDAGVFFVEFLVEESLFGFADGGEDVWFAVVVTVGTDAYVDLFGVCVCFVCFGDTCCMKSILVSALFVLFPQLY